MKFTTASLLSWLAAGVTFAAADSLPTVYSYNQRDVKPLRRTKRTPITAEPLQGRDAPPHYQSGSHLFPAIHPNLNRRDVQHLHKRQAATLFYSKNGGIYLKDADMVASIDATFHWEAVILDHSASIKNVTCAPDQMSIILDSPQSFQSAKNNWTTGETIVFVSSDKTCHTEFPGQYGYFNTSSVSFNSRSLTATAKGKQISADQAVSEFNVVWGEWQSAGAPKDEDTFQAAQAANARTGATTTRSTTTTSRASTTTSRSTTTSARSSTTSARSSTTSGRPSTTSAQSSTTSARLSTTTSRSSTPAARAQTSSTTSRRPSSTTATTSGRPSSTTTTSRRLSTTTTSGRSTTTNRGSSSTTTSRKPTSTTTSSRQSSSTSTSRRSSSTTTSRQSSSTTTSGRSTSATTVSSVRSSSTTTSGRASSTTSRSSSTTTGNTAARLAGASTSTTRSGTTSMSGSTSSTTISSTTSTTLTAERLDPLIAPTGTGVCAAVPTVIPAGIPSWFTRISCETDFDRRLDNFFTYLADVANLDSYLKLWAPGTGITSVDVPRPGQDLRLARRGTLAPRSLGGFFKGLIRVVTAIVKIVVAVAKAIVAAIRFIAESILPTWNPSGSFNIAVDMGPPSFLLTDTPWGKGFKMYEYKSGESAFGPGAGILAEMVGADKILTFEIDGVEQLPMPGVEVWCVDCGFGGDIKVTGSAVFTIIGPTRLILRMVGDLDATLQLGINGFAEFSYKPFEKRLLTAGLPGFSIPGVISIGPYLTLDVDAEILIELEGQMLAGLQMEWPAIGFQVDFMAPINSKAFGYAPRVKPVFNVSATATVTASLGIPIGVNVGVSLLGGIFDKSVALVDRPALQAVAKYSEKHDSDGSQTGTDECPGGIYFYSNLVNTLELEIFDEWKYDLGSWEGEKFLEGCVSDQGVATVRQQRSPVPAGFVRTGCAVPDDAFSNGGFDGNYHNEWQVDLSPKNLGANENAATAQVDGKPNQQISVNRQGVNAGDCFVELCEDIPLFPGTCRPDGICDGGCDAACDQPGGPWKIQIQQPMTMCTYTEYEAEFSAILVRGDDTTYCKAERWFINGVYETGIQKKYTIPGDVNTIYPSGSQNKNPVPVGGPITMSIPAKDNTPSYRVLVGLDITCYGEDFDLRLDNFKLVPNQFAQKKRSIEQPMLVVDDSKVTILPQGSSIGKRQVPEVPEAQPSSIPVIGEGTSAPEIAPANNAPNLTPTLAAPQLAGASTAPDLSPNNEAPSFDEVPLDNKVTGTIGAAVPTATAVRLGRPTYQFPTFDEIMEKATQGVIGAAPAGGSGAPYTGWHMLPELSGKSRLAAAEDGNFYLVSNSGGASPSTNFYSEDSIAFKDEAERMFYYFPATMNAYGVSRMRAASPLNTPLTAQVITIIPVTLPDTGGRVAYVAADTSGNNFLLAWCTAPKWQGSKVFLVSDYDKGLNTLMSGEVQWIVTGNNVTECDPLVLTSNAGGLPVTN